jgi:flagellin
MQLFFQQQAMRLANRGLSRAQDKQTSVFHRLATGNRVTKAADDAAGLAIGTKLAVRRRSREQAGRNANDAVNMAQVAQGSLGRIQDLLSRGRERAVQAANDHLSDEARSALVRDYADIIGEIGRLTRDTRYQDRSLLDAQASASGSVHIQVSVDGSVGSNLAFGLMNVAPNAIGRTDPMSGPSLLSSGPVGEFTLPGAPAEATLQFGAAPYAIDGTAELLGSRAGPFTMDGLARVTTGNGPFTFTNTATVTGSQSEPFTIAPAADIVGSSQPGFDVVAGENDRLILRVNNVNRTVDLGTGYKTQGDVVGAINQVVGSAVASVKNGALVLQATGEVSGVRVAGGTARATLGWTTNQTSTAQNSLVVTTQSGTHTVVFAEGSYTADQAAGVINSVVPGFASSDGGRVRLSQTEPGAAVTIRGGTANGIFGFTNGTSDVANDTLRYRVNLGSWREVQFGDGTYSASQVADAINLETPGVASVNGSRVRLESSTDSTIIAVGTGTANGELGLFNGQQDDGDNYLSLRVGGTTRTRTMAAGTYTAQQVADEYNSMFPGVADVVGGRVRLRATGPAESLYLGNSTATDLLGFPPAASSVANNVLQFRLDGGATKTVTLGDGNLSAQNVVDAINGVVPDLAEVSGGRVLLRHDGTAARIQILSGPANSALGLGNNQVATAPVQGEDFIFQINGQATTVHFDPGTYDSRDVRDAINRAQPGFATLLEDGRLRLAPLSVGNTNTVRIGGGGLNSYVGFANGQQATGTDTDSIALTHVATLDDARTAIDKVTQAIDDISRYQAELGSFENAALLTIEANAIQAEAEGAARERIMDADFAREATEMARAEIQMQANVALTSQAKALNRSFLELYELIGS